MVLKKEKRKSFFYNLHILLFQGNAPDESIYHYLGQSGNFQGKRLGTLLKTRLSLMKNVLKLLA